jgi:hypothetical protein
MKFLNHVSSGDKIVLRELAKVQAELSQREENRERKRRIRDMHSLKPVRPPVWVDEIPWHEMDMEGELNLVCESEETRNIEEQFRRLIYRWKHIQADMVVEDSFYIPKSYTETSIGIERRIETLSMDVRNNIVAKHYLNVLDTEEKIDSLAPPVVAAQPEDDVENLSRAQEIFHDILPVKLRGVGIYYTDMTNHQ